MAVGCSSSGKCLAWLGLGRRTFACPETDGHRMPSAAIGYRRLPDHLSHRRRIMRQHTTQGLLLIAFQAGNEKDALADALTVV